MFFFISGYGLEYKRSAKGLSLEELPKRLKKLFTPTLLPIIMYVSGLLIVGHIDKLWKTISASWFPLPHSWFVVILAVLYVGFYLCASLAKSGKQLLILLFLYSATTVVALKLLHAPGYMIGSDMAVFIGALYKQYEDWLLKLLKAKWTKIFVAVLSVVFVLTYLHYISEMPKLLKLSRYFWLALMFMMFAYIKVLKNKLTDFLTRISYDVYLCQGIAFGIIPYKEWNFALSYLAICLLTVAIAMFCHWAHSIIFKR